MRNRTFWHVLPTKAQIGLRVVWSESTLSAWRNIGSLTFQNAHSEDSDQTARMRRLIGIFAGRTCPKNTQADWNLRWAHMFELFLTLRLIKRFSRILTCKDMVYYNCWHVSKMIWFQWQVNVHAQLVENNVSTHALESKIQHKLPTWIHTADSTIILNSLPSVLK